MGYGYQERDLDKTIIDWSGLTKTISDGLSDEYKRREDLKFQIDKTQAEELKKISEFEQGSDPNANKWAMKQAQQARDFKMMNHRMMKDGLISVNDAKLISQNVMDGWAELNTGLKSYNENFKRIGELGGKGNEFLQGQMAKFADIENKSIWNDPKTGTAYFVDINPETGEVDKSTLKPVRSLNNIQAQSFETINVEEATAKLAKNAKPWELATSSTSSIKDARLNPVYKQWKENSLASLLSSDQKIASTLMDYLDLDPTDDMNDDSTQSVTYERVKGYDDNGELIMETVNANIGKIKMKYENGKLVPNLTDEQRKLAKDAVESSLEAKLARTTKRQYVAPQKPDRISLGKKKNEATYNSIIAALQGNEDKFKTLFDPYENISVPSLAGGTINIPGKSPIELQDNEKFKTISSVGGRIAAQLGLSDEEFEQYARKQGVDLSKISEKVIKFGGFENVPDKPKVNLSSKVGKETIGQQLTTMYNKAVDRVNIDEEKVVGDISNILTNVLSLRGEDPSGKFNVELDGNDTIKITVGDKVIKFDDNSKLNTYREKVDEAMKLLQNSEAEVGSEEEEKGDSSVLNATNRKT